MGLVAVPSAACPQFLWPWDSQYQQKSKTLNKLTPVFLAFVLLLIINLVITLSKLAVDRLWTDSRLLMERSKFGSNRRETPPRAGSLFVGSKVIPEWIYWLLWQCYVIYQTRVTVFHRDIQIPRRELKIRRAAEYFWRNSRCLDSRWNTVSSVWYIFLVETETKE